MGIEKFPIDVINYIAEFCDLKSILSWSCSSSFFKKSINLERVFRAQLIKKMSSVSSCDLTCIALTDITADNNTNKALSQSEYLAKKCASFLEKEKLTLEDLKLVNKNFKLLVKNSPRLLKGFYNGASQLDQYTTLEEIVGLFDQSPMLAEFLMKFFCDLGHDINAKNIFTNTILCKAVAQENRKSINFLVSFGAKPTYLDHNDRQHFNNLRADSNDEKLSASFSI